MKLFFLLNLLALVLLPIFFFLSTSRGLPSLLNSRRPGCISLPQQNISRFHSYGPIDPDGASSQGQTCLHKLTVPGKQGPVKRAAARRPDLEIGVSPPSPSAPENPVPGSYIDPSTATSSASIHPPRASNTSSVSMTPTKTTPSTDAAAIEKVFTIAFRILFTLLMLFNINITWRIPGRRGEQLPAGR